MTREFEHYTGCRRRDVANCGGCALTHGGREGPNYSAWPLVYMENGRMIPAKWIAAFKREIARTDNRAYADNVIATARRLMAQFSDGTTFDGAWHYTPHGCACERGSTCDKRHNPDACGCAQCDKPQEVQATT